MIYNIAICDDEKIIRKLLNELLVKWSEIENLNINIESFSSSESFLFNYEDDKKYNILLLDIEMPGINGVELAKLIRKNNKEIQIIFITGYMDYIEEGYDVDALHYLLKPVNDIKLYEVLNKAIKRTETSDKLLYIETNNGMENIPLHDIVYVEVDKNYVTIHTINDVYTIKETLKNIENRLDNRFFKVNRSFLVNLSFIKRTNKIEVELKNNIIIPLSRGKYDEINKAIINYF